MKHEQCYSWPPPALHICSWISLLRASAMYLPIVLTSVWYAFANIWHTVCATVYGTHITIESPIQWFELEIQTISNSVVKNISGSQLTPNLSIMCVFRQIWTLYDLLSRGSKSQRKPVWTACVLACITALTYTLSCVVESSTNAFKMDLLVLSYTLLSIAALTEHTLEHPLRRKSHIPTVNDDSVQEKGSAYKWCRSAVNCYALHLMP